VAYAVSLSHHLELHVQFLFGYTLCCGVHEMLADAFYFEWHVFGIGGRCKENELLSTGVELGEPVLLLCLNLFFWNNRVSSWGVLSFFIALACWEIEALRRLNMFGAVPVGGWTVVMRVVAAKGAGGIDAIKFWCLSWW
jgi:hypothetical protein